MQMADALGRTPQRSSARSNRTRILATARQKLRDNPDASLDSIAQAAGVARRTLYGHFSGRQALVAALTREAGQALQQAFATTRIPGADPLGATARMALAAWAVGDQYRMLISLGRRDLGAEAIRAPWRRRAKRPPRPCDVVRTKACSRTMFPRLSSP
ncbi:TetR/AcrR family transcriptional regulator [Streptomyces mirabilis]|uniref:TetR/AcrR family transcriptional regulator n=1 Tax=Streptomyces mirabilis TaxID=68239 RepID=UPI000A53EA2B|nr:helix-turn-helix domain-containing protein [Streptomyces mirabilis]